MILLKCLLHDGFHKVTNAIHTHVLVGVAIGIECLDVVDVTPNLLHQVVMTILTRQSERSGNMIEHRSRIRPATIL
eukprot:49386-Eustigmatos_ZCMA.PRE.1